MLQILYDGDGLPRIQEDEFGRVLDAVPIRSLDRLKDEGGDAGEGGEGFGPGIGADEQAAVRDDLHLFAERMAAAIFTAFEAGINFSFIGRADDDGVKSLLDEEAK